MGFKIGAMAQAVNRKFEKAPTKQALENARAKGINTDKVSISKSVRLAMGKQANAGKLETLMKQREEVIQKKNELIAKTSESGQSMETIKEQVKLYEEQINNLDEQMSQLMVVKPEELEEQKKETAKNETNDASKTPEKVKLEADTAKIGDILDLSLNKDRLEVLDGTKTQMKAEVRKLDAEIEFDEANSPSGQAAEVKRERRSELNNRLKDLQDLMSNMQDKMNSKPNEIAEEIKKDAVEGGTELPVDGMKPEVEKSAEDRQREAQISDYNQIQSRLNKKEEEHSIEVTA